MNGFNSDAESRLAVAVGLVNGRLDGTVPGVPGRRPDRIFEDRGYGAPGSEQDWDRLASLSDRLTPVFALIAEGQHPQAVAWVNRALDQDEVRPQLEPAGGSWRLHFHALQAQFAAGWAAGIIAALALAYSAGDARRIGRCGAPDCARFFLDQGRNRRRRFCSLQCQNRAKSAAYRGRRG